MPLPRFSNYPEWLQSVHHDGSAQYVSTLYPRFGDSIELRLRTGADAPLKRVFVRAFPDGEAVYVEMQPQRDTGWWAAALTIDQPVVHYRFVLEAQDGLYWYNAFGASLYEPLDAADFRILADYAPPGWLAGAVFYQVYPDRFANGDPTNDPQPDEYEYYGGRPQTLPCGEPPPEGAPWTTTFYGGDLQGIVQHLDHLQALGVNTLYLNPIFTAYSAHRYDAVDYAQVDPHLGGDEALIALREALTARGMRYILDAMPNHCGYKHPWFLAAQADANAPEATFFTFTNHPDEYESWLGHKLLVKLNYESPELRRRMYENDDSIFRRWLKPPYAADGWRVDVGNMLGRQGRIQLNAEVARGIRRAVKTTRPDSYLIGENFFDAAAQLQGDQWDGVMNYAGFAAPLWHWLRGYRQSVIPGVPDLSASVAWEGDWPTAALVEAWQARLAAVPWAVALQQFNLLGSHDTPRIRSVVGENDALHRLAVVVQMAFPGVPGVYYGDEIGLVELPSFRATACMDWDDANWDHDLLDFYRRIIALRKESAAMQRGGFQVLAAEEHTFAFQRERAAERVIVVAHRGDSPRPAGPLPVVYAGVPDSARFVEYFTGQEAVVRAGELLLPEQPQGASLWREAR